MSSSTNYVQIAQDTFEQLVMDAGMIVSDFDVSTGSFDTDDIITSTTGGVNVSCVPTFSDMGEDVDNCPNNMMEMKHLDSWESKISTTALSASAKMIKLALGAADTSGATYAASADTTVKAGKTYYTRTGSGTTQSPYVYTPVASPTGNPSTSSYYEMTTPDYKIVPRKDLSQDDFVTIWWIGAKAGGGYLACKLMHALSTGGLGIQTTKNGKGQLSIELTGHVSINSQSVMPMEFYSVNSISGS